MEEEIQLTNNSKPQNTSQNLFGNVNVQNTSNIQQQPLYQNTIPFQQPLMQQNTSLPYPIQQQMPIQNTGYAQFPIQNQYNPFPIQQQIPTPFPIQSNVQYPTYQQIQPNPYVQQQSYVQNSFPTYIFQQPPQQRFSEPKEKFEDDDPLDLTDSDKKISKTDLLVVKQDASKSDENVFDLSFKMKNKVLQLNSASATTEPILFTLKTNNKDAARAPLDLVCVIDVSGSMMGHKIALVRKTLTYLLGLLGDDDRISIVEFEDWATRLTPLLRVTDTNKPKIQAAIDTLRAKGGNSIYEGIAKGVRVLEERKYRNTVSSLFLLSDGVDFTLPQVEAYFKNTPPKDNFTMHAFGYGSDHDPKIMSAISKIRDGNFYFIEKIETVDECFVDAIGGLISVIGKDTTITIQAVKSDIFPNIEIKKAFGDADMWKVVDGA
eukprot:CAMPEP_0176434686 /NCGR_PEP_ID=MMETSP0127-20121128/16833_1 /TAXON_ID=938130 /ORGANISM="Platyophrya macrostoma, Strain WH" /LENGTH=432 /DNA_ID=CAMNT_0017817487 /DNA_START=169 /DNA_END=1463 /DNA_ORIENTATION=-